MEDSLIRQEVRAILRRLYRYYHGRAQSCMCTSEDNPEARSSLEHQIETARWIAKRDAICKVAENLSLSIIDEKRKEQ